MSRYPTLALRTQGRRLVAALVSGCFSTPTPDGQGASTLVVRVTAPGGVHVQRLRLPR